MSNEKIMRRTEKQIDRRRGKMNIFRSYESRKSSRWQMCINSYRTFGIFWVIWFCSHSQLVFFRQKMKKVRSHAFLYYNVSDFSACNLNVLEWIRFHKNCIILYPFSFFVLRYLNNYVLLVFHYGICRLSQQTNYCCVIRTI